MNSLERVHVLNADGAAFEVHSVPLGMNSFVYARGLVRADEREGRSLRTYRVEWHGDVIPATASEVTTWDHLLGRPNAPES